jgi:hypothetical protein
MSKKNIKVIILIGILTVILCSPKFSFAFGPAPFNDATVSKQIRENTQLIVEEYSKAGKLREEDSNMDLVLFSKDITIKAFEKSGYDFSKTIALMAEKGIDKDAALFKEIILPLIIQIEYSADGDTEIFSETDAKNLFKLSVSANSKDKNMDIPDYNLTKRDEIDSLLKKKWNDMTSAIKRYDIEGALEYFMPDKREMYRELFNPTSGDIKPLICAIKKIEIKDIDLGEVK